MNKRSPIKKSLSTLTVEQAHNGSGSRQVLFSKQDAVSEQFEAWTKGFLPAGSAYDWHQHDGVDEFFVVLDGTGVITYKDGTQFPYVTGDSFYNPAGLEHRIENTGSIESVFYFFRVNQ